MSSTPLGSPSLPQRFSNLQPISISDVPSSGLALDAYNDARNIVRLLQCPSCSKPLQEPVTLPCANSLCKRCIPELHIRHNVSYPADWSRSQGFTCPFEECGKDHAIRDCSVDVTLNKIRGVARDAVETTWSTFAPTQGQIQVDDKWSEGMLTQDNVIQLRAVGRLTATYIAAERGELPYGSDVVYTWMAPTSDTLELLDAELLEQLKNGTRSELDCQVCFALLLDPVTCNCGHTFCRKCLQRAHDHSNLCPACRREMTIAPGVTVEQVPSNILLNGLLSALCPEAFAERANSAKLDDDMCGVGELDTALFICTVSFPTMPTYLHIFEPRYRLMVRRAMESGNRKFGMLLHNPTREIQGDLGPVNFYQYGTVLHINRVDVLPDGRSLIETSGCYRFRVLDHGTLDGYAVGKVVRVNDVSIAEEESIEAAETSASTRISPQEPEITSPISPQDVEKHQSVPQPEPQSVSQADLDTMSTQELMELGASYIKTMREQSAAWLHIKVIQAFGEPPEDPALFPWWFASVLPISDSEKYKLLSTSSVRTRLKLCAVWVEELNKQKMYVVDFFLL